MRDHLIIFLNVVDEPLENEPVTAKREIPFMSQADILSKPIEHLELSVRSNNCLRSAGIEKIYELVQKSEDELLKTKNFGRKSLGEIKETLANLGLGLNLDLNPKLLERIKGETKDESRRRRTNEASRQAEENWAGRRPTGRCSCGTWSRR